MDSITTFLGIDQGSSSTKAVLLDDRGQQLLELNAAVPPRIEDGRKVEQDPEGLLDSVLDVFARAKSWAESNGITIKGAGLAVQRSGVIAWNAADGRIRHPMMTWADTRTQPIIQGFGRGAERISTMTGLPTIPHFAAGKIHTLQRQFLEPSVYVGTLDTFLIHRMSGKRLFVTEDTMAARTMLYALADRGWSEKLCRDFAVDAKRIPKIVPSLGLLFEREKVPFTACLGDQQAALIGRLGPRKKPLLNLGTIASLTKDTGFNPVQAPGLMTSVLLSRLVPNGFTRELRYLVELTSPVTGTVLLEPLRRTWATSSEELGRLCEASFAEHPDGRAIAYFVDHRAASPTNPEKMPNVTVCKEGATSQDRARALVENVGNIIVRMLEEFAEQKLLGEKYPAEIDVAGGGSELDYLCQYISDVSGHTLTRVAQREAGARGAALSAWMHATSEFDASSRNAEEPERTYRCERPDRRKRFLMWQKLEQDILQKRLPPQAEVEE